MSSGGHFDYMEYRIQNIADQIEEEIVHNDVPFRWGMEEDEPYGHQHPPEVLDHLKELVRDLRMVFELVHEYDYAVSCDTDIERFLEVSKKLRKERNEGIKIHSKDHL